MACDEMQSLGVLWIDKHITIKCIFFLIPTLTSPVKNWKKPRKAYKTENVSLVFLIANVRRISSIFSVLPATQYT